MVINVNLQNRYTFGATGLQLIANWHKSSGQTDWHKSSGQTDTHTLSGVGRNPTVPFERRFGQKQKLRSVGLCLSTLNACYDLLSMRIIKHRISTLRFRKGLSSGIHLVEIRLEMFQQSVFNVIVSNPTKFDSARIKCNKKAGNAFLGQTTFKTNNLLKNRLTIVLWSFTTSFRIVSSPGVLKKGQTLTVGRRGNQVCVTFVVR